MLIYGQRTGVWTKDNVVIVDGCYSGNGIWMNQTDSEFVQNHGPIPRGVYTIGPLLIPHDPEVPHLGPSMKLTPDPANIMGGRFGFYCHLRDALRPLDSSDGCIVFLDLKHLQCIEWWRAQGENQVTVTALVAPSLSEQTTELPAVDHSTLAA